MVDLATQNNTEAMALIHKVDILLYHPLNEGYRPTTPEALLARVHGANRALQYEQEGYRAPQASKQVDDMLGNPFAGLMARLPPLGKQALGELMKKSPLGKWLEYVQIGDQALGEKLAEIQYQFDKVALWYLDEAARRATPGSLSEMLQSTAAPHLVWDGAARLLGGPRKATSWQPRWWPTAARMDSASSRTAPPTRGATPSDTKKFSYSLKHLRRSATSLSRPKTRIARPPRPEENIHRN
jgi:hypothetical protein